MNRRDFIQRASFASLALGIAPALLQACSVHDPLHDFGIITGLVKKMMKDDPRGTLKKLADMGYVYLEFGGTFGMEPSDLKSYLSELGLKPLAGGASMANFQGDGLKKYIDQQLEMDKKYLVCYWPWMHSGDVITMDDLKFGAEQFHRIGEACNKAGLRFAYHNHDKDFKKVGDVVAYDYFVEHVDPEWMTMELDIYWITVAGEDPVEYISKYPGRFELLHVKDSYDVSNRESFACVGSGKIDFDRIFRLRDVGGFKHLIVEQDRPEDEESCARSSIEYLKSLKF